ncbi:translation initiation factor eIF2B subunit beta-like [Clytia hemisphaerica]|uniref:translation initiation factor eIF2B subunit beta-like n=1 Tax=Clytia hemisphaerica TaxID=252671 RepID=UPI0034D50645|eukprot:TCONS_00018760-protein
MVMDQYKSDLLELSQEFQSKIKQNSLIGSFDIAHTVVLLFRKVVGKVNWINAKELIECVRFLGKSLFEMNPSEVIINMVKRVSKLIREEYFGASGTNIEGSSSLQTILMANNHSSDDLTLVVPGLKSVVIDSINELISELETSRSNIALKSSEYIHSNEIIMTYGKSRTVELFLKKAFLKRKFSVIVAECAPFFHGQELAKSLAEHGIETTVIPDSAVFAIMSRVNKVIIGAHTVYADGGLKASNGAQSMALAAKHHAVPVIVCSALFKLTPKFVNQEHGGDFVSPELSLDFNMKPRDFDFETTTPKFTYIKPDTVDLLITDVGGNSPSYVYRLVAELYQQEDDDF